MQKDLTIKEIVDFMTLDLSGQKLRRNVAFYLASNQNLLRPHYEAFEAQRKDIFQKYGKPEGENLIIPQEKMQDFLDEMKQLLESKVTVTLNTIKLEELPEEIEFGILQKMMFLIEGE
ncbi:hypothetical protein [Bellilinea sp.]|jgi:hypothetical protein|uniref:hypothetical protein n=1 Tax=Bellilinea sp. TaxID=2838785 RepID=UPI002ADDE404|nr:hypothetical protein [Bellilinea sp.]